MLFRPLAREVYVQFSGYTRVVPSLILLEAFPRFLFEFVKYKNLKDRYNNDMYLTDDLVKKALTLGAGVLVDN
ncbi:hypothetical protein Tco_0206241 [Tanacetum coccineum]